MRIVLARRRDGRAPMVHAFRVDESDPDALVWYSVCGGRVKPDELEVVERFTGVPCVACSIHAALDSKSEPPALEEPPVVVDDDGGRFSISWRERVVHRIRDDSPRIKLDGRTVVAGLCAGLGWGPVANPPVGWSVCSDCADIEASEGQESDP